MYVVVVDVRVVPGESAAFLEAIRKNHEGTRQEPGNVRFDVLRPNGASAEGEPEHFLLYEVYKTAEDFTAHQQTPHYHTFRTEAEPLMAVPRKGVHYTSVYPDPWH